MWHGDVWDAGGKRSRLPEVVRIVLILRKVVVAVELPIMQPRTRAVGGCRNSTAVRAQSAEPRRGKSHDRSHAKTKQRWNNV